jgi:Ca-activated chloride channel family protein
MNLTFHDPQLLWLLCALPLLLLLHARRGRRAAIRFASVEPARALSMPAKRRLGWLRLPLSVLAFGALIVGLARPQRVDERTQIKASGTDLVLAVDVSSSMDAQDMQVDGARADRLSAVKSVVERFIADRPSDRIGLIAFAGAPYLVSPPTLDHDWLQQNLARLHIGLVQDGTAIGSALTASVNRLRHEDAKSKTVILLTDGMNNAGTVQPSLAAQAAAAEHVKVYTIGVGSEGRALTPVKDDQGNQRMVMTEVDVDEAALRQIADTTNGRFFRATDTAALRRVYSDIDAMEQTTRNIDRRVSFQERFQLPVLAGLSLLALSFVTSLALKPRLP